MDPLPPSPTALLLVTLAVGLTGCPQAPVVLAVHEEDGTARCELRVPNRLLDEVVTELSERMEEQVVLGDGVDGRRRVAFAAEAPTCRGALDLFAADLGLVVRESRDARGVWLELVARP